MVSANVFLCICVTNHCICLCIFSWFLIVSKRLVLLVLSAQCKCHNNKIINNPLLLQIAPVAPLSYKHLKEREWKAARRHLAVSGSCAGGSELCPSCMMWKEEAKRTREKMRGKRGFSGLLTSFCSVLNSKPTAPNAPSMPAEQCPALCFKISAQKTWMSFLPFPSLSFFFRSFLSFFFILKNTSLQMNAYTAALSVALPNCCVLTSSCDIHSNSGSLAWKTAEENASLHWCSNLCILQRFHEDVSMPLPTVKGYSPL